MWIETFTKFAQESLTGERELEALWSRGVSDDQILNFRVGYIGTLPQSILRTVSEDFSQWWQRKGTRDVFVFPLTNPLGQIKGFQVRKVDRDQRGYSDWILSKEETVLFGLSQSTPHLWSSEKVVLVEGVFDFFPVQRVYPNSISTLTAAVSQPLSRFLKRMVKEVWFCYDSDSAGFKGVKDFTDNHLQDFSRVLTSSLPRVKMFSEKLAKDPSDVWEALGDERFGVVLRNAFAEVRKR